MRKLILIAALVLVSATAQAGTRRGLTVASNEATKRKRGSILARVVSALHRHGIYW